MLHSSQLVDRITISAVDSLLYYMVDAWHESCTELNFYLLRWLSPQVGQAAIIQLPASTRLLIENPIMEGIPIMTATGCLSYNKKTEMSVCCM